MTFDFGIKIDVTTIKEKNEKFNICGQEITPTTSGLWRNMISGVYDPSTGTFYKFQGSIGL